jgi:hypothetical protein
VRGPTLVLAHRRSRQLERIRLETRDPPRLRRQLFKSSSNIQGAGMEAIKSHTSFKATEYLLVAVPAAVLLTVYLFGSLVIRNQFDAPKACRLDAQTEYAAPHG